jgi:hypothetical protein
MAASNYEVARDCIDGTCATGEEACAPVCAQLNSTFGTADAGPCPAASDTDGGPPPAIACMALPDAGACPTNFGVVVQDFQALNCAQGVDVYEIISGPTTAPMNQCCYTVHQQLCSAGGRPYLVDGQVRTAKAEPGTGWGEGDAPCLAGLASPERAELAKAWTEAALAEHASVASFARFSLDLLAVGAPADLVEGAHGAAIDEVRHAKLCFALAAAYAGEEMAPGAFPVAEPAGSGGATTLLSVAMRTATEGCVDETIAAVLAADRALRSTDRVVRAVLERIAEDEARHAELAWRTVAWAVREGGGAVLAAVEDVAVRVAHTRSLECEPSSNTASSEVQAQHGCASARDAALSVRATIADVILPATMALRRAFLSGGDKEPLAWPPVRGPRPRPDCVRVRPIR